MKYLRSLPGFGSGSPGVEGQPPYTDGMPAFDDVVALARLVALLRDRPKGLTIPRITSALIQAGSIDAGLADLGHAEDHLFDYDDAPDAAAVRTAEADLQSWIDQGIEVFSVLDARFPGSIRDVHECPPILYAMGTLVPGDVGVSVVGSRNASELGLQIATGVADGLAQAGFTVISGLAAGIDAAAHTAALGVGGRTVAVIGTGVLRSYPAKNKKLQDDIAAKGLVLSQFWPDAPPTKASFPVRNATMSGLGIATFIAEAGEHSGARIQARKAVEHGRPVILSDLVVRENRWAQNLLDRPRVYEAASVDDVLAMVKKLSGEEQALQKALDDAAMLVASGQ